MLSLYWLWQLTRKLYRVHWEAGSTCFPVYASPIDVHRDRRESGPFRSLSIKNQGGTVSSHGPPHQQEIAMFRPLYIALMFFVLIGISIGFATAQITDGYTYGCSTRQSMADTLVDTYAEKQFGVGIGKDQMLYEFWVNEETGTWTILKTYPNGRSCVVVVGDDFVPIEPPVPTESS